MEEKSTKIAGIKVEEWYENALSMKEKGIDLPLNFTVSGASMNPIIRKGLDVVTVLPKDRIKLYDVVLFKDKRNTADYVLHRVVKIDGDVYTTCGDGGLTNDAPITEDKILGVATKIKRGKKPLTFSFF